MDSDNGTLESFGIFASLLLGGGIWTYSGQDQSQVNASGCWGSLVFIQNASGGGVCSCATGFTESQPIVWSDGSWTGSCVSNSSNLFEFGDKWVDLYHEFTLCFLLFIAGYFALSYVASFNEDTTNTVPAIMELLGSATFRESREERIEELKMNVNEANKVLAEKFDAREKHKKELLKDDVEKAKENKALTEKPATSNKHDENKQHLKETEAEMPEVRVKHKKLSRCNKVSDGVQETKGDVHRTNSLKVF